LKWESGGCETVFNNNNNDNNNNNQISTGNHFEDEDLYPDEL
jgi:hypothetical protein